MKEELTKRQRQQYLNILGNVMDEYPNDDKRVWFDISSERFLDTYHYDIKDEETIGVVFDEYLKEII